MLVGFGSTPYQDSLTLWTNLSTRHAPLLHVLTLVHSHFGAEL